uniref:Putative NADPH-dependent FMN reductase n=1 Tax=Streptomyces versipellis TaxID=67375 RepID=A0A0B6VRE8_9ACTN|nr:putative NADPH-dependent FMN reductase [Streptomyces versipellis]
MRRADGPVIGSPGYQGGSSGLVKNAADLLEDLRDDTRVHFDGRAVGQDLSKSLAWAPFRNARGAPKGTRCPPASGGRR